MKQIVEIIVNKNWETEPVLNAMTNPKLRPAELPFPSVINTPKDGNYRSGEPRAKYDLDNITVIVRCVEDLMDAKVNPSSSEEKYKVLPKYIESDKPDLIISISTAESTPDIQPQKTESVNGSVFIGGGFFMFDARDYDPTTTSKLNIGINDIIRCNNVVNKVYELVDNGFQNRVLPKFIAAHKSPASKLSCMANADYVSIGVVNIINYKAYEKADPAAYNAYIRKYKTSGTAATIETTHGIVRMSAATRDIPTLFISPITDRYEHFNDDATDTQNYIAAFNAGITVGELVCSLDEYVKNGGVFRFMP